MPIGTAHQFLACIYMRGIFRKAGCIRQERQRGTIEKVLASLRSQKSKRKSAHKQEQRAPVKAGQLTDDSKRERTPSTALCTCKFLSSCYHHHCHHRHCRSPSWPRRRPSWSWFVSQVAVSARAQPRAEPSVGRVASDALNILSFSAFKEKNRLEVG